MKRYALLMMALFALMPLALADTHTEISAELDERIEEMRAERNPNGLFYGLQNALDRLRLNLERNQERRAEHALEISERRLAELRERAEAGDERGADRAARAHERNIEIAERALERVEGNGEAQERMERAAEIRVRAQTQLEHVTRVHQGILERQEDRMSEEQIDHLREVFARIAERLEAVDQRAEERRQNARTQARAQGELTEEEMAEVDAAVDARTRLAAVLEAREQALQERIRERNERAQEAVDERADRAREQLNAQLERQLERVQENLEERRQRLADRAQEAVDGAIDSVIGADRIEVAASQELRLAGQEYEQTVTLYARATADGEEYERARTLVASARSTLADAREQFVEEHYERAQTLAREARTQLREARSMLTEPTTTPADRPSSDLTGERIQAYEYFETVQQAVLDAQGISPELDRARERLARAEEALLTARRALADDQDARRALLEANERIDEARELLSQHSPQRPEETDDRQTHAAAEIRTATQALERARAHVASSSGEGVERARQQLSLAEQRIQEAERAYRAEEYTLALRAVNAAHGHIEAAIDLVSVPTHTDTRAGADAEARTPVADVRTDTRVGAEVR